MKYNLITGIGHAAYTKTCIVQVHDVVTSYMHYTYMLTCYVYVYILYCILFMK